MKILLNFLLLIVGFVALIKGADWFVDGSAGIAKKLRVPGLIIGLTIVAGGTSLPELATSVVAARKGQSEIAIGNVIGSNVFNIFMILGITGLITPMNMPGITLIDLSLMVLSIILLWFFTYTKFKVERWEGAFLFAILVGYMWWLIANA